LTQARVKKQNSLNGRMFCRQRKPSDHLPFTIALRVRLNNVQIHEIRTARCRYKYNNQYTILWKCGGWGRLGGIRTEFGCGKTPLSLSLL